jgi:hypothetical protein
MNAPELDAATIRAWSRRTRAASGLPAKITDGAVLAKIVTLAFAPTSPGADNTSGPAVGHRAAQPSTAAKAVKGRDHHATTG